MGVELGVSCSDWSVPVDSDGAVGLDCSVVAGGAVREIVSVDDAEVSFSTVAVEAFDVSLSISTGISVDCSATVRVEVAAVVLVGLRSVSVEVGVLVGDSVDAGVSACEVVGNAVDRGELVSLGVSVEELPPA